MKKQIKMWSLFSIFALMFLQGCGELRVKTMQSSLNQKNEDDGFFQYPYKAKPDFYTEMILLKPPGPYEDISRFHFAGAVAFPSDPQAVLAYEVHIRTPSGDAVCPSQIGTLSQGRSSIGFECVTAVQSAEVKVELIVGTGGAEGRFERNYRWGK